MVDLDVVAYQPGLDGGLEPVTGALATIALAGTATPAVVLDSDGDVIDQPLQSDDGSFSGLVDPGTYDITITLPTGEVAVQRIERPSGTRASVSVEQTANYTLALPDQGKVVEINSASARTVTVPPNAAVAFPIGANVELARMGAGTVAVAAGAGVTIRSKSGLLTISAQYAVARLRKRAIDEWVLTGELA